MTIYFFLILLLNLELIISSCFLGYNHCLKCDPITDLCFECEKDIYSPDDKGGCENAKKCEAGNNHCIECEPEGNLCKSCEKTYFPDENGQCSYTKHCEISEQGKCLKCNHNYILIGKDSDYSLKICKYINSEDLKNCEKINIQNGLCEICKEGYYLNEGDKKCTNVENCYESILGVCKKCKKNYYLDKKEDKCKEQKGIFEYCKESMNGKKCDICEEDYYFDEEGNCLSINFCEKKGEYNSCQKCIDGYYLSQYGGSCTPEINCASGIRDIGVCNICKEKYYMDYKDGKCRSNQEDNEFKYCNFADEVCIECLSGFQIGKDNKCTFSQNCAVSEDSICYECIENYFLGLDNYCTNIKNCIYSNNYECIECKDDYYYEGINKTCKIAEGNFIHCKYTYNGNYCDSCKTGYYLNKSDYLCYSNNENNNFYKCVYTNYNGEYCNKCENNYYLGYKDYKCSKIENCDASENENTCIECCDFCCFDVKTGKCEYNDEIISEEKKIYYRCNRTNEEGTECEICSNNYTLSENGLCIDEEHCVEMSEDGRCLKCLNNEEESFCLNNVFGCIELYYDNCLECNDIFKLNKCTKCKKGYEIDYYDECREIEEDI